MKPAELIPLKSPETAASDDLRRSVNGFLDHPQCPLTQSALSKQLGLSPATLNRWLGGTYAGDNDRVDRVIRSWIADFARKDIILQHFFETPVTRRYCYYLRRIMATNDVGVLYGDAGIGKTRAMVHAASQIPFAVPLTLSQWCRTADDIIGAIWRAEDTRGWKGNSKRAVWLIDRFKGSNRPLLIDNAQRAGWNALNFLMDFHDETNVPILLSGNPSIIDTARQIDQHFSRIGICQPLALTTRKKARGTEEAADEILKIRIPEHAKALRHLAHDIARQRGHLRTLEKTCNLASNALQADPKKDPIDAFREAHAQLLTDGAI